MKRRYDHLEPGDVIRLADLLEKMNWADLQTVAKMVVKEVFADLGPVATYGSEDAWHLLQIGPYDVTIYGNREVGHRVIVGGYSRLTKPQYGRLLALQQIITGLLKGLASIKLG